MLSCLRAASETRRSRFPLVAHSVTSAWARIKIDEDERNGPIAELGEAHRPFRGLRQRQADAQSGAPKRGRSRRTLGRISGSGASSLAANQRFGLTGDDLLGDVDFENVFTARHLIHYVQHKFFEQTAQCARARALFDRLGG